MALTCLTFRSSNQLELMRRKQNAQHLDQRLQLLLENAYYQVRLASGCELKLKLQLLIG